MKTLVGVGYREAFAEWIESKPDEIECIELTAEHFFDDLASLEKLNGVAPAMIHGLGMSLGAPGDLDPQYLDKFQKICDAVNPIWISEHLAFTKTPLIDLGHLNPIPKTYDSVRTVTEHVTELAELTSQRVLIENITYHLEVGGPLTEPDMLNRICSDAGCEILLDVTNLYVNSRNHDFDPIDWVNEVEPDKVVQLHIVGYTKVGGRYEDFHATQIQPELLELMSYIIERSQVEAVIIERDSHFPPNEEIARELREISLYVQRD